MRVRAESLGCQLFRRDSHRTTWFLVSEAGPGGNDRIRLVIRQALRLDIDILLGFGNLHWKLPPR